MTTFIFLHILVDGSSGNFSAPLVSLITQDLFQTHHLPQEA